MRRSTNGGMRLVTPERIPSFVPEAAQRVTVGAAISDHPKLVGLLEQIVDSGRGVGISSLRADRVARKPDIARLLRKGGYRTLTVASDAASQRLRRTIAKGTTEKHLFEVARQAAEHDYKVVKVYMMVGVPDETDEDIAELLDFSKKMAAIHRLPRHRAPCPSATPSMAPPSPASRWGPAQAHRQGAARHGQGRGPPPRAGPGWKRCSPRAAPRWAKPSSTRSPRAGASRPEARPQRRRSTMAPWREAGAASMPRADGGRRLGGAPPRPGFGAALAAGAVAAFEWSLRAEEVGTLEFVADPPALKYAYAPTDTPRKRGWSPPPRPPAQSGTKRVVYVGDSVTFGDNVGPKEPWRSW